MAITPQTLFRSGKLDEALGELTSTQQPMPDHLELRATIDYLQGRYVDAITGFRQVLDTSTLHPLRRYRARRQLSLAYFQTNQFDAAASLPLRDPLTRLMRAFSTAPNMVTWSNGNRAALPFLQEESWELPRVPVSANGQGLEARIDTGGDLFSIPWSVAERIGVAAESSSTGWFAGGRRARTGRGILNRLDLGEVTIRNVPVSINSFEHAIVGTGLLRQFRPTLDYPTGELVLRPRDGDPTAGGFPFAMAGTHLLITNGAVNGIPVRLLIDSGLEVTNEGCFLAPESTLAAAGISWPESEKVDGTSGAGRVRLDIGEFTVDELRLGATTRREVAGLTGIFPPQLSKPSTIGFPLDGLISHNFLRHYRWTLDFDRMTMSLEDG